MIDVLMLTRNDWANTGYRFSKCLEMLGLRVLFLKGNKHVFGYPEQGPVDVRLSYMHERYPVKVTAPHLAGLAAASRTIHYIASTYIDTGADLKDKNVVVQHGGSTYRIEPERVNQAFNPMIDAAIIQCPDLLNLGAKNEHLIYYPVDTSFIKAHYRKNSEKVVIGHFPSDPYNKGTDKILETIKEIKNDPEIRDKFEYVGVSNAFGTTHQVPWQENLERMKKCDIIIETHKPQLELDGRPKRVFGEWGNTAIEAAALGKSVITNSLTTDLYKKEYGESALHIANDKEMLKKRLYDLICMDRDGLIKNGKETRGWVVRNHSMEATAIRLWNRIYSNFFPDKWTEEPPNMDNLIKDPEEWIELKFKNNCLVETIIKK